ncbi:MAG: NADP-specific glutamate dehydrogenase [Verrucomicrobiae bacterium]|nr:NADP-specific glutamate dehydrogenase [Verrucomicrobiae bacterium]MDW8310475.1 NADP-specific glutamate dehydrogenase [Verrucomicrobiales bacterium]
MRDQTTAGDLDNFLESLKRRYPAETEFHQAVTEVAKSVWPFIEQNPKYRKAKILERLVEPERVISFRVTWLDRHGEVQVNRGYRVQMNSAIGPYKGGLRFHPSVTLGTLKFLAFEQVLKNALTTLPMGGGKGGADFDPKGRTDEEIMVFCQAFMTELFRHIGPDTDVPAGDIGVSTREIGYLFGQYKKLRNEFTGALTGKGINWSGSRIREEATGYGLLYFVEEMLRTRSESLTGKTVVISGSGNVAQYAAEQATLMGARVVTLSDSGGFVHDPAGLNAEKLAFLKELKKVRRGRISEYAEHFKLAYYPGRSPWAVPCHIALPCATQNEISGEDAKTLLRNGCTCVAEGANMPSTPEAVQIFLDAKILFGPGKAANAGGVAVSGLEMTQNSMRLSWTRDEVDKRLSAIMKAIHNQCVRYGERDGFINYVHGANIAAFHKVAEAMLDQGCV